MHCQIDIKNAAKLLAKAFSDQGVTLPHQASLNLMATLQGFESYAHLLAADTPKTAKSEKEPVEWTTYLMFGEEDVTALSDSEEDTERAHALQSAKQFSFSSEEELSAFQAGVWEAAGWLCYQDVTEDVLTNPAVLEFHKSKQLN